MKHILSKAIVFGIIGLGAPALQASTEVEVTAVLTADNHYGLYYGNKAGTDLTFVNRNEFGYSGSTGSYNWSAPETWNFSVGSGQFPYVVAWDDGLQQSWIGEFTFNSTTLLSDSVNWEYIVGSGGNPGESGDVPLDATLSGDIFAGGWSPVGASAPNGSAPWGTIPGISEEAKFIWGDSVQSDTAASNDHYFIFRPIAPVVSTTVGSVVPEAGTAGAGTALLALTGSLVLRRRRQARG